MDGLTFGPLHFQIGEGILTGDCDRVDLTRTESQILTCLLRAQGAYRSRDQLMEACWEDHAFIDDNTLAVNMTRLRKKLAQVTDRVCIQSKRQVGYALVEEGTYV